MIDRLTIKHERGRLNYMANKNVVFLVLDSLRKDRTSIYNDEIDFTPTLQDIAESSETFDNAVSQAPWTLPVHVSMFTGEYPWEHEVTQSKTYLEEDKETFIQQFNEARYNTGLITSNVWLTPHKGTAKDFDYVENFLGKKNNRFVAKISKQFNRVFDSLGQDSKKKVEKYIDKVFRFFSVDDSCKSGETVEATQEYLSNIGDEDFFLFVNLMEPHEPYNPPKEYLDKHGVKETSKIPDRQKDLFTQEIDYEELRKIYDASTDYTDDLVEKIIDSLEENDLRDDTVVIVVSDHGQALGEDDIFGHQFTVDPTVTNTLMMIDNPERESDNVDKPVELRKLNELTPYHAGIADEPKEITQEIVKGGYEFPSVFIGYVPENKWDKYYKKYRYIQTESIRTVKQFGQNGKEEVISKDLETGEEVETPEKIREELNKFGETEEHPPTEDKEKESEDERENEEEIKDRLEALGYS